MENKQINKQRLKISYLLQKGSGMWGKTMIWFLGTKQGFVVDHCQLMVHKAKTCEA